MSNDPEIPTMSFGDHLDELRRRLVYALVGPIPILVVCLIFGDPLLEFMLAPLEGQLRAAGLPARLLATGPAETFAAWMKVALVVTFMVAGPWIFYQAWLFVKPGLYAHERRFAYFLLPSSAGLTAIGAVFLYYVLLPVSLRFLILFGSSLAQAPPVIVPLPPGVVLPQAIVLRGDPPDPNPGAYWLNTERNELRFAAPDPGEPAKVRTMGVPLTNGGMIAQEYRVSEYIDLVFMLALIFALTFQTPLILMLLGWTGLVEPRMLTKHRKGVIFGCTVAAAIITPTVDPFTMILLGAPLYLLFELGILLMRWVPARRVAEGLRPHRRLISGTARPTDGNEGE